MMSSECVTKLILSSIEEHFGVVAKVCCTPYPILLLYVMTFDVYMFNIFSLWF